MKRVLLVEDNALFRQSFRKLLEGRYPSLEITEASDGNKAMEKVDASSFDLIFMDIRLPDENGLTLTHNIMAKYPETTIIVLTHYDLPEYREIAIQNGASYFLCKSMPSEEILSVVGKVLQNGKPEK